MLYCSWKWRVNVLIKQKQKNYIKFFLFIILLIPLSAKANVVQDYNTYNKLLNLGFTNDEIKNMSVKEIEMNKNLNGTIVAKNIKYLKTDDYYVNDEIVLSKTTELTQNKYNNMNTDTKRSIQNGYIETSYKKLTTTIISTNFGYRYKVSLEWKTIPKHRGYDIIGIGINNDVYISSSFTFKQNYCYSNGNCSYSYECLPKETSYGGAALFLLPSSNSINSLNSYLYFNISKKVASSTLTRLEAYGDYSHNTKNISLNNANTYNIYSNGIHISSQYLNYYDEIGVAKAIWTGTW